MPKLSRRSARPSKRDGTAAGARPDDTELIEAELIKADVLALAAEAEAEAAEAEAEAARARAALLDHADAADDVPAEPPVTTWEPSAEELAADAESASDIEADDDGVDSTDEDETPGDKAAPRRLAAIWPWLAAAVAAVLTGALIGVSVFLVWHHREQDAVQTRRAEFVAAANTGVVNLLSMDFSKGDADLQRLIDSTTGEFRSDFENTRGAFLNVLRASKATTTATIKESAVAQMGRDSALVLVAAGSEVSNTAAAKQPPRAWRLAVTVRRDGDQIKMSKVEFVL
ncbi:hypothetical protein MINS_34870 [Mycolicibacterium insubricum]|uniref:Uncharacterized protein n=1 Tax=Mycolicibacterium insubricum TaxID=444597 RepID=A0A1X0DGL4_9MYCO|nr:hypothetical protein [Mycolicibacterium insubricum]MCV7080187.1 hypothetical protein [Mycolicibacterium insubricum]ORA71332.1 hypothetical protein BST26_08455 [Mycolicibacterium insubricum]BBZ68058.1 hypothetical protein MINS_34870 [Mycolicibacterium insubricum]